MGNSFLQKPITDKKQTYRQSQRFKYSTCEMQGWRRHMQDAFIAELRLQGYQEIALFGVFDGHGGAQVSKFVANHFVENLIKRKSLAEGRIGQALHQTFIQVQLQLKSKPGIQQQIKYKKQYMKSQNITEKNLQAGTTANVIAITKDRIICANAGDSRASLFSNSQAIALSIDHKPQNPIEKDRIEKTGVPIVQGRVNGLNLTRSIGDFSHKKVPGLQFHKQPIICVPQIKEIIRKKEDKFILLGCDGIWQKYGDDHVQLTNHFAKELQTKPGNQALKDFFDKNISTQMQTPYGKDNMTAIIIEFLEYQNKE